MSLGFRHAGFEVVAAMDHWLKAVEVYRQNFDHPCHLQDLSDESSTLQLLRDYRPDIVTGGPPCQDFSSAGKRDVSLGRADLTCTFANLIVAANPRWFVMENVERIKSTAIMEQITKQWSDSGYGLSVVILNASRCGVPQRRKRLFIVGERGGAHNRLNSWYDKHLNSKEMTLREYFGDELGVDYYYRHPRTYRRRGVFSIDEPSPTIRGVNRPVPSGYKTHSGDPPDVSLDTVRPLTTAERARVQTFPEHFVFPVAKTHAEQMIGNAVPVALATFVARGILAHVNVPQTTVGESSSQRTWAK